MDKENPFDLSSEEFRRLGYGLVDKMAELLENESRDPVITETTGAQSRDLWNEPLPQAGTPFEELLAGPVAAITKTCRKNGHPRFFGYVSASADPVGVLADALASVLNQNMTAWRSAPGAAALERQVVRWLGELTGFQGGGHGLLTSGGSMANSIALSCALARTQQRAELPPEDRSGLTLYLSRESHLSMPKAALALGIPPANIRRVDVDENRRLRLDSLQDRLRADLAAGLLPFCVCASAGTANTGIIDPLEEIARLCTEHDLWFHIDGAYGAPAVLTEDYRWMARAFSQADSLSLDPHKWLFAPLDVGCVLLRDSEASRRAFSHQTEYVAVQQTDPYESFAFFDHGPELSRRFRALKVWMILKARGTDALAAAIDNNIQLRRHLDSRIAHHPQLELLGSDLSISCFRFLPNSTTPAETLNALNRRILETLVREGRLFMSPTALEGRYSLRICIVNFRTTKPDIDFLLDEVLRVGNTR
ncbi:MAG: aminotransferase class V-fold PLP-dependent enzyme [Deltaproteobacteria bacterium]|nr:aminotransferase class V-fold PLP-dependent enzyme [Deltaproteobacteria bacterium]